MAYTRSILSAKWSSGMATNDAALPWICSRENFRVDREENVIALATVGIAVLSTIVRPPVPIVHLYDMALAVRRVFAPTVPHIATAAQSQWQVSKDDAVIDVTPVSFCLSDS